MHSKFVVRSKEVLRIGDDYTNAFHHTSNLCRFHVSIANGSAAPA